MRLKPMTTDTAQHSSRKRAASPMRTVLTQFATYARRHRALLAGSVFALLAGTAFRLLEPWPLALVIDQLTGRHGEGRGNVLESWLAGLPPTSLILVCALGVIAVAAMSAAARYLATLGFALAGNRILGAARLDLHAHLQRLSLAFHHRSRAGDLTMRLTSDIAMLKEATVSALLPLLTNLLVMVGMFTVMLVLDWQLTLFALIPMPLMWWLTRRRGRRIYEASRGQRKREGEVAASASETLSAIRTVQSLALEDAMTAKFGGAEKKSVLRDLESKRLSAGLERGVDLLVAVGTALVLWQGAIRVVSGALSPGDLLVFLSYLKSSFRPIREYAKYTGRLSKALAAGERVADLFAQQPEVRDRDDAVPARRFEGALHFDHVHFGYDGNVPGDARGAAVLDGLELRVAPGERVAVIGASGAGKSTLASLLLRLYDPQQGAVRVDGQDIRQFTLASLRRQIALVPQETLLFAASVRDNIAIGMDPAPNDDAIAAAARIAHADAFIAALPQGYDSPLSERAATLSGGQRQRLAIARAAVRDCPIVVLDEPTTGLDPQHLHLVNQALLQLLQGRTGLIITHDLGLAAQADRIVVLESGRVLESGTPAALRASGGMFARWWRMHERNGSWGTAASGDADDGSDGTVDAIHDDAGTLPERSHAH